MLLQCRCALAECCLAWRGAGRVIALLPLLLAWWCAAAQAGEVRVLLVLSESGGYSSEFHQALQAKLGTSVALRVMEADALAEAEASTVRPLSLVIAVGAVALQAVLHEQSPLAAGTPVLAVLTPRASIERIAASRPDWPVTAIWLEPPPESLLRLFGALLPGRQRLGLLLGPDSDEAGPARGDVGLTALRKFAERQGVQLDLVKVRNEAELPNALLSLLPRVDALLLYPDRVTYNRTSLRLALLVARRSAVPVLGVSQGSVQAGALAAVYINPAQIADEVSEILVSLSSRHSGLPPSLHSSRFSVATNPAVAQLLKLPLPSREALQAAVATGLAPESRPRR